MLEKQLDIELKFKYDLADLKNCIKKTGLCKILTDFETNDCYQLMFACENEHMPTLNNIVAHKLADFYVKRFKKHFFQQNIKLAVLDNMFIPAYICALSSFDNITDREIALQADYKNQKIVVTPFLYFKLHDLVKRWKTIIALTNENIGNFNCSNSAVDLLCYLLKNQQHQTKKLDLFFTEKGIKIYDDKNLTFESKTQTKNDIANMIAVLVKLCPEKLNINSVCKNSYVETVKKLFCQN